MRSLFLVYPTGVEPAASRVGVLRSIQLSYGYKKILRIIISAVLFTYSYLLKKPGTSISAIPGLKRRWKIESSSYSGNVDEYVG